MRPRTQLLALLGCLAVSAANAYPPAPFFQIYGSVRDDHGNPLSSGTGTVILSGSYAALGTATVSGTGVGVVTIQNGGSGFTSAPTVSFSGGTGTNAIGTAILTDGVVTGVTVNNPGSGYTSPVTVAISGGGAPAIETVRSVTDSAIAPGINYSLSVPMDSGTIAQIYDGSAMRNLLPFTIRVVINGVNYVPIQIRAAELGGTPRDFWKTRIDSVNDAPGIQTQGNSWAVGLAGDKLRLDLWLGVDSDNDGLPDEWEWDVVYSDQTGRLTDISQVNPGDDLSGNGMTNMDKFIAGVYALEALDGLHFTLDSVSNGVAALHFQAITGRTYHIAASADLKDWTKPQAFSIDSTGGGGGLANYYQATDSRILHISVPLGIPPVQFFKLYAE